MKTINEFLSHLNSLDVKLWTEDIPGDTADVRLRCNAPKDVLTPDLKTELTQRKAEILEFLLQLNLTSNGIKPVPRTDNVPLSFAQQRLWFLDRLEPGNPFYNQPTALRLTGDLQIAVLEKSLREIIRRHEILRTSFAAVGSQTIQVIKSEVNFQFPLVDLTSLSPREKEREVRKLAQQEAEKPFNLEQDLLLRATLLKCDHTEYIILFTTHHIVSDGWSTGILIQEIATLYQAFLEGKPSPLPELRIQYADFAVWQREWLQGKVLDNQVNYWKQQLGSNPPILNLPTDYRRPNKLTYQGARESFTLSTALTQALKALCQKQGVTLFMLLLAVFKLLLHRYSHQDDIVVGTPIANRNRAEIEGLIGFFVNTLVLRTNLEDNPSFKELLQRVKQVTLGAYSNQDLPFEQLVEELKPKRHLNRNPLFDVMFALQNAAESELTLPGLTLSSLEEENKTAKFDLSLDMFESSDRLSAAIEYSTDLFEPSTIARMARHFQVLLESIITQPETPILQLPLLTKDERQRLLFEWNDNQAEYPLDKCIHTLFEAQVNKNPNAVAVIYEDQQLTYRQLNEKANQLAHYLQTLGVKSEILVGICVERSIEMLVGLLGVLKAGGAYIPLNPNHPSERLTEILSDAQVSILLTQEHLAKSFGEYQTNLVCIDSDWELIAQQNHQNPIDGVTAKNLAYVIYTSGSTGKPKGVMVEHSSLVNNYFAWSEAYQLSSLKTHLQMANFAFDVFTGDLVRALCSGGKLVLCPHDLLLEAEQLYSLIKQHQVDCGEFVPVVLRNLMQYLKKTNQLLDLNLVICGSDSWYGREYEQFQQFLGKQTRLINSFGVTEATIDSCYFERKTRRLLPEQLVPIGKPYTNTQLYILDSSLQPVPIGIPGELYIGGAGVARGYFHNLELTQEKFVPHPFQNGSEAKLYKTGDRACYLPDGNIKFLGRIDYQVKMRGFRIELGEIEVILVQHPAIKESVVIAREDIPGDKRLVAYYVAQEQLDSKQLRNFIKSKLPDYMIPSAWVQLDAFPLTPNGKCDRNSLPIPDFTLTTTDYVAFTNPQEEILTNIWQEVLNVESVGINDNFFELGGHSLLATQVISKIRQSLSIELPLRSLFEHPTIAELTHQLQGNSSTEVPSIQPVAREGDLPLSFAQQRLWFLAQLEADSPAYNIPEALRLQGQLNINVLTQTLEAIVQRHEVLRTNFTIVADEPVQVIHSETNLKLPIIDLSHLSPITREQEVTKLTEQEVLKPFDLERDSLLQVTLIRLNDNGLEHIIFFTTHHIISDGWSTGILVEELATLYQAFLAGKLSPLAELPIQYADFAVWQRDYLKGEVLDKQLNYWKEQLGSNTPILNLPTDYRRPNKLTYQGATKSFVLDKSLTKALKTLAQKEGVTLFMTLIAAFQLLMHRYSHQDDILVGTAIANRNRAEIEGLIGFFVNTLVLRTKFNDNSSFSDLLQQVKETTLRAYSNQDLPFEQLVEELKPERHLNRNPLFDVMFTLQNAPESELTLPGLTLSSIEEESSTAKFDLSLDMFESASGLEGVFEYSTDLFKPSTIARMAGHFQVLLEAIVAKPEQLSILPLLTPAEKQQILVEWNNTQVEYPQNKCIHILFEEQVAKTPDAVAVVFEYQQLTYQELNNRANQLAHYLQKLEVKPEVKVAICLERSLELVIGLLAILKAAGAYIPLDPSYPRERLAFMLDNSQAPILITRQHIQANLPPHQAQVVFLEREQKANTAESTANPICNLSLDNLAYVIYTSGSTGKPKGAMNTHQGILNRLLWMQETYGLTISDCVLQKTPFSFDVSVWEFFWTLITGARLVVAQPEGHKDPNYLINLISQQQITTVHFVPSMLQVFLEAEDVEKCQSLVRVISSGEALPAQLQQKFFERLDAQLHNLYGPTEAAIDVTSWQCQKDNLTAQTVPIGHPIANIQIYLLDRYFNPVPVGVTGELYLGGVGVGRGYLNPPDLTAEKFIPNPFSQEAGERLYRTGDLARYLSNGEIEYIARIDHQVKVRGFRIELGEIEKMLVQHSQIRECLVIAREDIPREKRLVAYYVAREQLEVKQLREYLKSKLPDYMIPGAWVELDAFPLTPNGKCDRNSLPIPDFALTTTSYIAPCNPQEEILANIWQEVLNVEQVGIDDNFFELGGHSLLATQVISKIRQHLSIELPLRCLFEHPTISELARQLQDNSLTEIPLIQPVAREKDSLFPLSFAQQRLWFLAQLEPDSSAYNIPEALRLQGQLNINILTQTLEAIVQRHEVLRTNFTTVADEPVQVIHSEINLKLPVIDLTNLTKTERELEVNSLTAQEADKSFDLEQDCLLRVSLIRVDELEHIILFTMHHISSDGWSTGILVEEFATLYQAFLAGKPSPLPELPIQYADYAVWQRDYLQGEVLDNQLNYWKQKLGGNPPILDLPTDYRRPNQLTYQGATHSFILSESLTKALKTLSQKEGVTLFMTLIAAFKLLMHRYSHQEEIIIGTPIANRNRAETESLIGFFVNTLVLRTKFNDNSSFCDLLQQVKETTLEAYDHQDLPFEQLVEELKPKRHLNRNPLFDVMFVLQNAPESELALPGLTLSSIEEETKIAKFDLSLDLFDSATGLEGVLEYSTDLFKPSTIERMVGHFQILLEEIATNSQQKLAELSLLTAKEKNQLLVEWNNTQVKYPQAQCIHQLFEEQVAKTPDTVAIVFENQQLTYQELNTRANQLAHYIKQNGLGSVNSSPEILIGICVERSLEMVIGLLAILKAGGAYIPLDPNYPEQRLSFILEQANVSLLLSEQKLLPLLSQSQADVICLDSEWQKINQQDIYNPIDKLSPNNLAYLIYTSGSTGKPKGVQITHTAVVNFLTSMSRTPGLTATDILLSVTTISFDIAALEIYLPLIVGARLVLVSREVAMDGNKLSQQLALSQGNVMQATPATWRLLLDAQWQGNQDLKILCGGEALDRSLANQLLSHTQKVWNLYGPTETTIWSAAYQVKEVVKSAKNIIPIGSAIANTQFYLLDQQQQLVPVGVVGELYIGGVGLARGYFNRPDLTNEKFILNPFEENQAQRLYKTGDKARYLPNGELEYIGRIDHQVKIRGFRIELGEIEVSLRLHPAIKGCVIISHEDQTGDKRLVAYYVAREQLDNQQLREYLKSKLPDYMIPTAWVQLDALPLTPNGKCDRKSLPIPDFALTTNNYIAPGTPQEEILAQIWQEVLDLSQVGIQDNFFELGGHSLLATQVVSKIRQRLSIEFTLRSLFELPTIAELAVEIEQSSRQTEIPSIKRVSRERNLPLSFAQQRLWFLAQLEPDSSVYNVFDALRLQGKLDINVLIETLTAIIQRHEVFRTTFTTVAGEAVQVINPTVDFQLPIIDLASLSKAIQEQEVQKLADREALQAFDLERDSLLRITLIKLNDLEHIVLFTMHHIICDGWSMKILVREVATLYEAFSEEKPSPLLELPIQYADYAVWQRDWLQGNLLQKQLTYWEQQLADSSSTLALPTDRPRPSQPSNRGKIQSLLLSKDLSTALKSFSQREGVTLFMSLLASYNALLYYYTQQEDILVGSPIANRNQTEIEGLIGFFINTLVLRTDLSGNPSFRELLYRVRQTSLEAYTHQDLPFEKLVAELQQKQNINNRSLFQVWFTLENASTSNDQTATLSLPDLTLSQLNIENQTVPFDLALLLSEGSEGIAGFFEYKTDLFEQTTILHMAEQWKILLQSVVNQPDLRLDQLVKELKKLEQEKKLIKEQEYQNKIHQKFSQIKQKSHK